MQLGVHLFSTMTWRTKPLYHKIFVVKFSGKIFVYLPNLCDGLNHRMATKFFAENTIFLALYVIILTWKILRM